MQLSWDLHVHAGPSSVPRWGTGRDVRAAARRAGVKGFVWKSHETHTARASVALGHGVPRVIGSASLNPWAAPDDVEAAIDDGARWIWGPTRREGPEPDWDLPLPAWWETLAARLGRRPERLVLATGHLDAPGRHAFARLAAASSRLLCSVTHALWLSDEEVEGLRDLGCRFEVDLYTAIRELPGRQRPDLVAGLRRLSALRAPVYITTDAGQPESGDPYELSRRMLGDLVAPLGSAEVREIARTLPDRLATHVLGGADG